MAKAKAKAKKGRRRGKSSGASVYSDKVFNAFKAFGHSRTWVEIGKACIGSVVYVLAPTALETMFKVDLTGWKMPIIGTTAATVVAALAGEPAIAVGGFASFGAHWMYAKGQGIMEPVFKTGFARFDAQQVSTFADDSPQLQTGAQMKTMQLPSGRSVNVAAYPALSDYSSGLSEGGTIQDYTPALNDYSSGLSTNVALIPGAMSDNFVNSLNDEFDGDMSEFTDSEDFS